MVRHLPLSGQAHRAASPGIAAGGLKRRAGMLYGIKGVDLVAAVGCDHLISPTCEADAGDERTPAANFVGLQRSARMPVPSLAALAMQLPAALQLLARRQAEQHMHAGLTSDRRPLLDWQQTHR